jgi:hypothetical protein
MTPYEFAKTSPKDKVKWLSSVSPTNSWASGDDIFCLHCDALFKAEDIACDDEGDPTYPLCHSSTPLDFHHLPWWREDLCKESGDGEQHVWRVEPLHAKLGELRKIPASNAN